MATSYKSDQDTQRKALAALKEQGYSLNDYIRHAIAHVAKGNPVPFQRDPSLMMKVGRKPGKDYGPNYGRGGKPKAK